MGRKKKAQSTEASSGLNIQQQQIAQAKYAMFDPQTGQQVADACLIEDQSGFSEVIAIPMQLDILESTGIPCRYVRFQTPVPPYLDREPVSEFKLTAKDTKYKVDKITYTKLGVIWRAGGEIDIAPLANVAYSRSIQSTQ